jgi:hypothetical protein
MATAGRGRARLRTSQTPHPATPIAGFDHHATPSSARAGGVRSRPRGSVSHSHSMPHAHSQHATTADLATISTMASHADDLIAALAEHQHGVVTRAQPIARGAGQRGAGERAWPRVCGRDGSASFIGVCTWSGRYRCHG